MNLADLQKLLDATRGRHSTVVVGIDEFAKLLRIARAVRTWQMATTKLKLRGEDGLIDAMDGVTEKEPGT